jgi:hypothetical protein
MSDYGKWFIATDGSGTTTKCTRERLIDHLKDLLGSEKAAKVHQTFRRATFSENCRLELELMEG